MNTFGKTVKKTLTIVLGSAVLLARPMAAFAGGDIEAGLGKEAVADESAMPQEGAGIGMSAPLGGTGKREGLVGTAAMGSGADLGTFGQNTDADTGAYAQSSGSVSSDTDTTVLEDLQITFKVQGSYMLTSAEDENFYYIYTWGQQGIPDIMVGVFEWNTTEGFFDKYLEYMTKGRPDITVAEDVTDVTIGDKNLQKVVYNYGVQGYTVRDTRYIWLAQNSRLYMFARREIPDIDYTLGNTLEDIIASAEVIGGTEPQPQTDVLVQQPETSAPQPETSAPQPETSVQQPETASAPAPDSQSSLYVKNDDSSWTVTTDHYTMTIPPAWTGHFDASVTSGSAGGYNLRVVNKESEEDGFGGHLFTVMLIPEGEDYTYLPSYDYLGTMSAPDGNYSVVIEYPTDYQTGGLWQEFYKILNGDKNTAITSIRPAADVTWTLPDGHVIEGSESADSSAGQNVQTETARPVTEEKPQASGGDILGTASGTNYTNSAIGFQVNLPAGWIMANQDQLLTLNKGLTTDRYLSVIDSGMPVCVAYAQSANGMEVMNVVIVNGASFVDSGISEITQDDVTAILNEAVSVSSSSLETLGASVTGASVNTSSCMGKSFSSLDITFDYSGFSGMQKQFGISAGTYIALITVRSVSGDNTQAMLDMFSEV